MKTYNYTVHTYCDEALITIQTDNLNKAVVSFMEAVGQDLQTDIVDNKTGEVLAIHSEEKDYCVDELLPPMVECALSMLTQ